MDKSTEDQIAAAIAELYLDGEPSKAKITAALIKIVSETRGECAMIAGEEQMYWGQDSDDDSQAMSAARSGAICASANICVAIFMGKSLKEVKERMKKRDLQIFR